MVSTLDLLTWSSLTATINEVKSPNSFLKKLLFSKHETQPTETIEIGVFVGGRQVAPFVRRNGMAIEIEGTSEQFQQVTAPNIRIKRHVEPSELLFNRRPGNVIFADGGEILSAAEAYVARQVQRLADACSEAEEFLCSKALQGTISYSVAEEEHFTITYPKPVANNITLTNFWNVALASDPVMDVLAARGVVDSAVGMGLTHMILGSEATSAFLTNPAVIGMLDTRNITLGNLNLTSPFQEDGAMFLGMFGGLQVWSYTRQTSLNGVTVDLIRPKYAEFVTATPAAENVLYYGAIPDLRALEGRLFQGERFSKSWEQEDPSVRWMLTHSRPLPVPRRPGSMVSMKVVSG